MCKKFPHKSFEVHETGLNLDLDSFFYNFRHFNDRAVYTCDEGYQIVGLDQVICNSDGHWSGAQPMCKQVRLL